MTMTTCDVFVKIEERLEQQRMNERSVLVNHFKRGKIIKGYVENTRFNIK